MSDSDDGDDDVPTLSAHTLAALLDFYEESRAEDTGGDNSKPEDHFAVGAVGEDWRMSQFWYTDDTATRLAEELLHQAGEGGRIACVSAPSVYQKLKQLSGPVGGDSASVALLEYDRRFSIYGDDFVFYDYNEPLAPAERGLAPGSFDVVLADPPYLSEECLTKVAQTVKYLSKGKVLLCTGAIMEKLAKDLLDVQMCHHFLPQHERNLSNDFRCFVNYPSPLLSC
ncbi:EEF1A lysine methyltransferase 1 isoform X2 [Syngnathoides biaculeatus]|nr:EEF1A lysine methyltransferase 1 isoform X2 [Syngnathoides biaculeatus]XP_061696944.1 EEF1A lysine methyltransferase 1 isoform X2 [Syngnathoides biaculeatus]